VASDSLIDLHRERAASAHLRTAVQFAGETRHAEIEAWALETTAWEVLTRGDYRLPRRSPRPRRPWRRGAPARSFRRPRRKAGAWARLGAAAETRGALARVEALVSPLPMPERPEHYYRYDPAKSEAYVATTLAWLGDPAAEGCARQVLARLESSDDGPPRPRRAASARLDLSLAPPGSQR
jgi:hypothetical protein